MSVITNVRINYRDDCFQDIPLKEPLPEEHAATIASMVLVMRNGEKHTPESVEFADASGNTVRSFKKVVRARMEEI